MTDAGNSIGRRIAQARKLRGLTQTGLAGRAHVSKSLIAQVESGHKPATPSLIAAVSAALHVDVTELTGQPYRGETARADRVHEAMAEVRQALVYWDIPPVLDAPPRSLDDLEAVTQRAGDLRMQAGYAELGTILPALISELVVRAHQDQDAARARAFGLLAQAYTAADSMAYKLGYTDLFALAVERMAWAASLADDALLGPLAAVVGVPGSRGVGRRTATAGPGRPRHPGGRTRR
jgi:transcriptional regulator with XRE-family HTH domain